MMKRMTLNVKGMHCRSCEAMIQESLEDAGVKAVASAKDEKVQVEFDEKRISEKEIHKIIEENGYEVKA
jgi:copper chaperone CopZ